ncbi:MAG TPA: hypothetical protein VFT43_13175 [Candidatus Polarisedimenticolia bacterium]|nr:hypothetical protein [Candidatus Polarisedimenticolia bacterium]
MATAAPGGGQGARILVVSEDDDVADPLEDLLRRAGHRVAVLGSSAGVAELDGPSPDVLILDRDLPPAAYREALETLASRAGTASFPLIILGGGSTPDLPRGWHEDAALSLARPPQPGEVLTAVASLRRLAFYRPYRDLVHSLSQPVTALHALSRTIARGAPADEAARQAIERLVKEADRLMSLMEEFQRRRGPAA